MKSSEPEKDWRRPLPEDWCYPCFTAHPPEVKVDPTVCAVVSHPRNFDWVLSGVLFGALDDLGIPKLSQGWHPAHVAAVRFLVAELQWRIEFAEQRLYAQQ